ncbi:uncharacterized protein LOC119741108 isoform X2 [Patiria miniata]|uniref:Uncharacterized protein n=1 Tax=Patiria miniata TaxID=46514 RepID=A0A914B951_PATMI|nr:uncharacterized protein LOC119741108 isoform X2 [Patiria miniata]
MHATMGYTVGIAVLVLTFVAASLSQECTFDEAVNPMCGWIGSRGSDYYWQLREGSTPAKNTGPPNDRSGSGKYMLARSSIETRKGLQRLPKRSRARLTSPTLTIGPQRKLLRFYYFMFGKQIGGMAVFVAVRGDTSPPSPVWRRRGNLGVIWHMGEIRLPANSTVKVVFEAAVGKGVAGDIAIDDITINDLAADCTFESAGGLVPIEPPCLFEEASEDHFDWQENTGKTPTRRTGPAIDHTLEQSRGTYKYIEATGPNQGEKAHLLSPRYTKIQGDCDVSFWYHMYGEHVGHLKVHIMKHPGHLGEPYFTQAGDHGNIWIEGHFNITNIVGSYRVVFEGIRGDGSSGDIAIDDVRLLGPHCITAESLRELQRNESRRDNCSPNPCSHGGSCQQVIGGYRCNCTEGWGGVNCNRELLRSSCSSRPCVNDGHCVVINSTTYTCECPLGWTGENCEIDVDECSLPTSPCQNGGMCNNTIGGYNCTCPRGWHSQNCDLECADSNKNCMYWAAVGECKVNPNYMLIYCQKACGVCQNYICEDSHESCPKWKKLGECTKNPYYMMANCHYSCGVCIDDECASSPCQNAATCVDGVDSYTCTCTPGFKGVNCEIDIDDCLTQPCMNNGTCIDLPNGFECRCTEWYRGFTCELEADFCTSEPCLNNGTCTDDLRGYNCTCPEGFDGINCEIEINECGSSPCQHGGRCEDQTNGYVCHCPPEWTGPECQFDFDECKSNPCTNGGTCYHGVGNRLYICYCPRGWQGSNCELEVNECLSLPCRNGATCQDLLDGFNCSCTAGWTGPTCATDISECASSPCLRGECIEGANQYECLCYPGFTGVHCEIDVDECLSDPCLNGGVCLNLDNRHDCICPLNWQGRYCEQAVTTIPATTQRTTPRTTPRAIPHHGSDSWSDFDSDFQESSYPISSDTEFTTPIDEETDTDEGPSGMGGGTEVNTQSQEPETEDATSPKIELVETTLLEEIETTSDSQTTDVNRPSTPGKTTPREDNNVLPKIEATPKSTGVKDNGTGKSKQSNPPSTGHIIAVVFGGLLFIAIVVFLVIVLVRQRRKSRIGKYEHFSMDSKDAVAWKEMDTRSYNDSINTESSNM